MALLTATDFIYTALRKCGELRPGYQDQPEMLLDGLNEWWAMFDAYNARRTMAFSIPDYIYPIGSNTGLQGIYGPNVQFSVGPAFTFSATLTSGQPTAPCLNTAGLNIGQPATGTGIPASTFISAFTTNTSVTFSQNATTNGASIITIAPIFSGPRPEQIVRMNLVMTSANPGQPTRIPITIIGAEEWSQIPVLQLTAINVTTTCYPDYQFPQMILNVWPPLNGNSLEIFTWGFLTPPASLTASYSAPPGYADVIIWELAKRLYHMCPKSVLVNKVPHMWLCGQAAIAKDAVRAVNAPKRRIRNDFISGNGQNSAACDWDLLLTGVPY